MLKSDPVALKRRLERLRRRYHRREYVSPDPLEVLYRYPDPADREVIGLVAATLAYGRVASILQSIAKVEAVMGPSPVRYLNRQRPKKIHADLQGFQHRWTRGEDMAGLLCAIQSMRKDEGSLQAAFRAGFNARRDATVLPALTAWTDRLRERGAGKTIATPGKGSACKRLHMYLRWLVRCDAVDPGGWEGIPASRLLVPLDTHLFHMATELGFTRRRTADEKAALEVTARFRELAPRDPVRYDFTLTRFGIRNELQPGEALDVLIPAAR